MPLARCSPATLTSSSGSPKWPPSRSPTASSGATAPRRRRSASPSEAVEQKILEPLNQEKLPGCYLHRSNPNDVARVEHLTFICTPTKDEAGPTNNWMAPERGLREARQALRRLDEGPHDVRRARTSWARSARRSSKVGIEITDSIYVVLNMRIMTRMGKRRARHARRLERLQPRPPLARSTCNPERRFICHFPQDNTIWSRRHRLRRQRPARQEVPRAPHRQLPRPQRGLARRAHADPRRREPRGRDDVRRGGVPERVRQDELRDDDPAQALQGLEDLDRRRRHRVDARRRGRPPLGHQPGGRLLRRRARARATSRTRTR